MAPVNIPQGRHTLGKRAGQVGVWVCKVCVQPWRRGLAWEDRDHPRSPLPPRDGVSGGIHLCQGRQQYCFLPIFHCHLICIDPTLPPIGTPPLPSAPPILGPSLSAIVIHKAICTYTFSPIRTTKRGSPSALLRLGHVPPVLSWPQITHGVLVSEEVLWEYRVDWTVQGW